MNEIEIPGVEHWQSMHEMKLTGKERQSIFMTLKDLTYCVNLLIKQVTALEDAVFNEDDEE